MKRVALSLVLSIVMAAMTAGCSAGSQRAVPEPFAFGVLGATCEPQRLAALRQAGVSIVELPVAWDRFEPRQGRVDGQYVAAVVAQLEQCRQAGIKVILSPGLHYPPAWVRGLPGGELRGSGGGVPRDSGAELIFSSEVRKAAHRYLSRLVLRLGVNQGLENIAAIRVGTNSSGELGYPGPEDGGNQGEFWAFGDAPQKGTGLAEGVALSPMPGWVPGSAVWNGRGVTGRQVHEWWDWYAGSAVEAVVWQVKALRSLGYQGRVHVPVAGRGVLPADKAKAVAGHLDGRANPDGAQERGLDYLAQFAVLSMVPGVDVDFTGLDDVSAAAARSTVPRQDRCSPGDEETAVKDDVSSWSSQRYTSALARRTGLGLVGENPGPPDFPFTGGSSLSDSLAEQLRTAPGYAVDCGMTMFLFGFEENLFDDGEGGVTLDDYKEVIQQSH